MPYVLASEMGHAQWTQIFPFSRHLIACEHLVRHRHHDFERKAWVASVVYSTA